MSFPEHTFRRDPADWSWELKNEYVSFYSLLDEDHPLNADDDAEDDSATVGATADTSTDHGKPNACPSTNSAAAGSGTAGAPGDRKDRESKQQPSQSSAPAVAKT